MVFVGRPLRGGNADQRDDIGRGVGERVKTVGQDRDRPRNVSEGDLGDRYEEIQDKDATENADDGVVAISQFRIQNSKLKVQNAEFKHSACTQKEVKVWTFTPMMQTPPSLHSAS